MRRATVTPPPVGLWHDENHNYYWAGQGPLPGASSIADAVDDKQGLIIWAKNETAACAVRNYDFIGQLVERGGANGAIKWLAGIPDFQRDTAADLGTAVHLLADQIARGANPDVPEEQRPFVDAYRRFLDDFQPGFEAVEAMVCNLTVGYGGKLDAIIHIDGRRLLVDVKTSRTIQPKFAVQLAGYACAEFVGRPNDPRKYGASKLGLSKFDGFAIIHVRPEQYAAGYALIEVRVGEPEWQAFLLAKQLSAWRRTARDLIGKPIPLPVAEGAAA